MPRTVPALSVVLPCYDERENLDPLQQRLVPLLEKLCGGRFEVIVVDDASSDGSAERLDTIARSDARFKVIHLSRNFGHQAALSAGLDASTGDAVVLMDCDLQDPPELIEAFLERWREGYHVVYGVRRRRKEGILKRTAYSTFYHSMRAIAPIDLPLDAGDFCLMDRRAVDAVRSLPESQRFLRGLRSWVGFRQTGVEYERGGRHAGTPKYTFGKLVKLALSGYIGFSTVPLRLASWLGLGAALVGFAFAAWAAATKLLGVPAPHGWASTVALILFVGGVQLLVLGVIGEYLGRVLDEVRRRPSYVVRSRVGFGDPEDEASRTVRSQPTR